MSFSQDQAEALALKALGFLVADEELLQIFMGSSGVSAEDLRTGVGDPAFLGSVLDFILMDDQWVVRFCDANRIAYYQVFPARQALPGGEQVNWT